MVSFYLNEGNKRVRTQLSWCPLITRYVRTPKTRKRVSGNPTAGASPGRSLEKVMCFSCGET